MATCHCKGEVERELQKPKAGVPQAYTPKHVLLGEAKAARTAHFRASTVSIEHPIWSSSIRYYNHIPMAMDAFDPTVHPTTL